MPDSAANTFSLNIKDLIVGADGTLTISNPELHKMVSDALTRHAVVDGPPLGPGTPGHPVQPKDPPIKVIFEF